MWKAIIITVLSITGFSNPGNAQQEGDGNTPSSSEISSVEVYYFHFTRRCVTCRRIEKIAREVVSELQDERVHFNALNIEKKEGREIAGKLGVNGQSLLIVSGDMRVDLTRKGFLYALSDPERLKSIILEKIQSFLL